MSDFPEKSVTRMYGSTLLALRGGRCVEFPENKHHVTLEWPLSSSCNHHVAETRISICVLAVSVGRNGSGKSNFFYGESTLHWPRLDFVISRCVAL